MEDSITEEIAPMEIENNNNPKKAISEKQKKHLEYARQKKREYGDGQKAVEQQLNSSISHIYNRLTNIEKQVSSIVSVKRIRDEDIEEINAKRIKKEKNVVTTNNPGSLISQSTWNKTTDLAIKGLCVYGVSTVFNIIGYAWTNYKRRTSDGDPIIFIPPI
jgi:hypothetical protein